MSYLRAELLLAIQEKRINVNVSVILIGVETYGIDIFDASLFNE